MWKLLSAKTRDLDDHLIGFKFEKLLQTFIGDQGNLLKKNKHFKQGAHNQSEHLFLNKLTAVHFLCFMEKKE